MTAEPRIYPGKQATAAQLLQLADEYHLAAVELAKLGRPGQPISRAPYRFAAIHAVELYLNALLRHFDRSPEDIRGLQHDLAKRMDWVGEKGLTLRARTEKHVRKMAEAREYQICRYGAEMMAGLSPTNRVDATLDQVAKKARTIIRGEQTG